MKWPQRWVAAFVVTLPAGKGESQPVSEACHFPHTVKHILVKCTCYSAARQRYFGVATLKDVFENVASRNIIAYIKYIGFCNRI